MTRPRWGGLGPRRRPLESGRQTNWAHMIVWISGAGVGVDLLDNERFNLCQLEPVFSIVYVVGSRGDS